MADPVSRYCPSCGARVRGQAELFSAPQKCPKCQQVVSFADYPNEPPTLPPDRPPPHQPDWFDRFLYVALAGIAVVALVAIGALVTGNQSLALFGSAICLSFSFVLVARFSQLSSQVSHSNERVKQLEGLADQRATAITDAISKYTGFKVNFDRLVADEFSRLSLSLKHEYEDLEREKMKIMTAKERTAIVDRLGARLLKDSVQFVSARLTSNNYTQTQDKLLKVIEFCRKHDFEVSKSVERELLDDLKAEFQQVVKRDLERQEQARIKAQMREEQKAQRELDRELSRIDAEKKAIQQALDEMIRKTHEAHSEEVEILRQKLREAEERAQRAVSMAQLTKCGHIYVISNIGSFGHGVFKVGMTRRLEPSDRVKELGDASVPFPFDVHMMISCDNAPSLESALHRALHKHRVNKVNLRKEFFRADFEMIRTIVEEHHGTVDYVADPEALEYNESQSMSDDTFDMLTEQFATAAVGPDEDEEFSVE